MGWFSKRKEAERPGLLGSAIPRDDERYGPEPPPPPSAEPPGVSVFPFGGPFPSPASGAASTCRARFPAGRFETEVHVPAPGENLAALDGARQELAALLLAGRADAGGPLAPGDLAVGRGVASRLRSSQDAASHVLLDRAASIGAAPADDLRRIGRDDLVGRGFSGVTGIRAVHRTATTAVLRLGPPPGARWALVGVRSLAVFVGRLVAIDGDEPKEIPAGHLLVVARPASTLYLQAGNDAALAVGFAAAEVVVALA